MYRRRIIIWRGRGTREHGEPRNQTIIREIRDTQQKPHHACLPVCLPACPFLSPLTPLSTPLPSPLKLPLPSLVSVLSLQPTQPACPSPLLHQSLPGRQSRAWCGPVTTLVTRGEEGRGEANGKPGIMSAV